LACRNPSKISRERLFEMEKKLYLVSIVVEGFEQMENEKNEVEDDDDKDKDDKELNDDECDDLDDIPKSMKTDRRGGFRTEFKTLEPRQKPFSGGKTISIWPEEVMNQDPEKITGLYGDRKIRTESEISGCDMSVGVEKVGSAGNESLWEKRSGGMAPNAGEEHRGSEEIGNSKEVFQYQAERVSVG
jgi:hypothetical protein